MRARTICANVLAITAILGVMAAPIAARADGWRDRPSDHRQQTQNQWKDLAIGAGALGLIGALTHNNTLTYAGVGGALYSGYRYEQDRNSRDWRDHKIGRAHV